MALAPRPHHPAQRRRMAPLNPRGGRPRTRLVRHVHQRDVMCHLCGEPLRKDLRNTNHPLEPTVDEIIPISKGGDPLDPTNCRAACRICNTSRNNRDLTDKVRARCRELSLMHRRAEQGPAIRPW